jgi:hypothetical protein
LGRSFAEERHARDITRVYCEKPFAEGLFLSSVDRQPCDRMRASWFGLSAKSLIVLSRNRNAKARFASEVRCGYAMAKRRDATRCKSYARLPAGAAGNAYAESGKRASRRARP